jgi:hypothetical protein
LGEDFLFEYLNSSSIDSFGLKGPCNLFAFMKSYSFILLSDFSFDISPGDIGYSRAGLFFDYGRT